MIELRVFEPGSLAEPVSCGVPDEFACALFENSLHCAPGERQ